ncbi:PE-PPE domain-containing protein [Mycobacterium sp.]|uniref:PE-PPE domain-containing protein n=1 Tax=Mycobacterium sp. TaxID=1785 RepID=UPI003BAE82CE
MNGSKMLAKGALVGMIIGAASAVSLQAAHAEETLPGPLSGSDTALILGGTTEPTPSNAFARAAENLFLHPLGFDDGATSSTVCDMIVTNPCAAPLQVLTTPELIQQGPSTLTGADDVTLAVENEFNAHPGLFSADNPLTIFGYSQSATADSIAMTQIHDYSMLHGDSIPLDSLHFVFIGDPSLEDTGIWAPSAADPSQSNLEYDLASLIGPEKTDHILTALGIVANDGIGQQVLGNVTPTDLYPATIYTLEGDSVAQFQQVFESSGLLGTIWHLFTTHVEYLGLTPEDIAAATTTTDGNLTLVDIPDTFNNAGAWLSAVFEHGAAGSGLLESVWQSLELYLTNSF